MSNKKTKGDAKLDLQKMFAKQQMGKGREGFLYPPFISDATLLVGYLMQKLEKINEMSKQNPLRARLLVMISSCCAHVGVAMKYVNEQLLLELDMYNAEVDETAFGKQQAAVSSFSDSTTKALTGNVEKRIIKQLEKNLKGLSEQRKAELLMENCITTGDRAITGARIFYNATGLFVGNQNLLDDAAFFRASQVLAFNSCKSCVDNLIDTPQAVILMRTSINNFDKMLDLVPKGFKDVRVLIRNFDSFIQPQFERLSNDYVVQKACLREVDKDLKADFTRSPVILASNACVTPGHNLERTEFLQKLNDNQILVENLDPSFNGMTTGLGDFEMYLLDFFKRYGEKDIDEAVLL